MVGVNVVQRDYIFFDKAYSQILSCEVNIEKAKCSSSWQSFVVSCV